MNDAMEATQMLPHHEHHKSSIKALGYGITASSILSASFAGLLHAVGIPVTVILPTTAPIWVGTATMVFMTLKS